LRSSIRQLYQYQTIRNLCDRFGPSAWKIPGAIRRRIAFEKDIPRLPEAKIWWFQEEERVCPFQSPALAENKPTLGHLISTRPFCCSARFVAEISKASLVGKYATPVTDAGRILLTSFRDQPRIFRLEAHSELEDWVNAEKSKPTVLPCHSGSLCSFVNRLESNYYHWMIEWCGQIEGLFHYREVTGITPQILIRSDGPAYLRDSLELLGYDPALLLEWQPEQSLLHVDRLIVTSIPGVRVASSPRSLRWLRQRFLSGAGINMDHVTPKRNLYIPRRAGGWRYVINDAEVCDVLTRHGFEILNPEKLSLRDQVSIFSEANLIVGMHGAGLTNILFAPHAHMLELIGDYGGGDYYSMTSGLGQQYSYLNCHPEGENIRVDTQELMRSIEILK
jgi:hypothetical protein